MHSTRNPCYFGVTVGRVANRIAQGRFTLESTGTSNGTNTSNSSSNTQECTYALDVNNDPNHLHGGIHGFHARLWESRMLEGGGVEFSRTSLDGEEGYPGTVRVSVTYRLESPTNTNTSTSTGVAGTRVAVSITVRAQLIGRKPTPINIANHSYFNLARHDDPRGILDHTLHLPNCDSYTPVDVHSIPTREVRHLSPESVMDFRNPKVLSQALCGFGIQKGVDPAVAQNHIEERHPAVDGNGQPYGFDHNYVLRTNTNDGDTTNSKSLKVAGIVEHADTHRRLVVSTNAPGVQIYTSNYLDGSVHTPFPHAKDGAVYAQWQGICLETQHFPDSILTTDDITRFPEFAKGRCVILREEMDAGTDASKPDDERSDVYTHVMEYCFEQC